MDRTLASGRGHLTTDPFSPYHETPGWWTEATVGDASVPRLFTVLVHDLRDWVRPRCLAAERNGETITLLHDFGGARVIKKRTYDPGGAACSHFDFTGLPYDWNIVQWTVLPHGPLGFGNPWTSLDDPIIHPDRIEGTWRRAWPANVDSVRDGVQEARAVDPTMLPPRELPFVMGGEEAHASSVRLAQAHATAPDGRLLRGVDDNRIVLPDLDGLAHLTRWLKPGRLTLWAGLAAETPGEDPFARAEGSRRSWIGGWADLRTEDPLLRTVHASRVEAYRRNRVDLPVLGIAAGRPFPTEGPGFFRNFVTFSAQCHLRDLANRHDPDEAVAILDNLIAIQRDDGSLPGHNYGDRPGRDHYHTDFSVGARRLHERGALEREHLSMLRRYADWLVRERSWGDPAGPNLVTVIDQNETGMEYMDRYAFVRPPEDAWRPFRMGAVDATVHALRLCDFLADMRPVDSVYRTYAAGYRRGLTEIAYDPQARWFADVDGDGRRSNARPATGFFPLLVPDLAERYADVLRWLPSFRTPIGIPAEATDSPSFSKDGEWLGRRMNCPWNGRSWPMLNCFVVEAISAVNPKLGETWLRQALLLHEDGSSWEHYSPQTGEGSRYRGVDDYLHNHLLDLIYRADATGTAE